MNNHGEHREHGVYNILIHHNYILRVLGVFRGK